MLFSSTISLLIYCLLDVLITDRVVLKSLNMVVDISISPCISDLLQIFFTLYCYLRCIHVKDFYVFLEICLLCYVMSSKRIDTFVMMSCPPLSTILMKFDLSIIYLFPFSLDFGITFSISLLLM